MNSETNGIQIYAKLLTSYNSNQKLLFTHTYFLDRLKNIVKLLVFLACTWNDKSYNIIYQ